MTFIGAVLVFGMAVFFHFNTDYSDSAKAARVINFTILVLMMVLGYVLIEIQSANSQLSELVELTEILSKR